MIKEIEPNQCTRDTDEGSMNHAFSGQKISFIILTGFLGLEVHILKQESCKTYNFLFTCVMILPYDMVSVAWYSLNMDNIVAL